MPFDSSPQHTRAAEIAIVGRMQELLATPDRWCQGTASWQFPGRPPAHCLVGALRVADYKPPSSVGTLTPPATSVSGYLRADLPDGIDGWNDTPGRTHAEVLDLLARVRRKLEEDV